MANTWSTATSSALSPAIWIIGRVCWLFGCNKGARCGWVAWTEGWEYRWANGGGRREGKKEKKKKGRKEKREGGEQERREERREAA